MPAYVKKFDPKEGLSCWAFGFVTDQGHRFKPLNKDEKTEGACCLISYNFEEEPEKFREALEVLEEIKLTGKRVVTDYGFFLGCTL